MERWGEVVEANAAKGKTSFRSNLLSFVGRRILRLWMVLVFKDVVQFASPLLLSALLDWVESDPETRVSWHGCTDRRQFA